MGEMLGGEAREDEAAALTSEVAELCQQPVEAIDQEKFLSGERYLHFYTPDYFGKLASAPEQKQNLQREVFANHLADQLGIPTVPVAGDYHETETGHGIIFITRAKEGDGKFYREQAEIAQIPSGPSASIGKAVAETYYSTHFKKLPENIDTSPLVRNGLWAWATESAERAGQEIEKRRANFEQPAIVSALTEMLGAEVTNATINSINELPALVAHLGTLLNDGKTEYFFHNDGGISNLLINGEINPTVTAVDYECAGATKHPLLGMLRDCQQFYWSTRSNPEMQQSFLSSLLTSETSDVSLSLDDRYFLARATALLGTAHYANFHLPEVAERVNAGTSPGQAYNEAAGQTMLTNLLTNLQTNLGRLDKTYTESVAGNPDASSKPRY